MKKSISKYSLFLIVFFISICTYGQSKNYLGKWVAQGRGGTYEIYINSNGSWYFINNWSRKELNGFYVVRGRNSLELKRELDNRERIVYKGLESITEFDCYVSNVIRLSPKTNRSNLALQESVAFYKR